jgi:hypothetical protein
MAQALAWLLEYPQVLAALLTFGLGLILQVALQVFAAKPRLRWGITSDTVFLVPSTDHQVVPVATDEPSLTDPALIARHEVYRSRTIWLENSGTAIAEEVELAFNWRPQHIEWFPHIPTTVVRQPDNRYILTVSRLNPKEGINFSLLSLNEEHPNLMHVRCKGYPGKPLAFKSQQIYPRWFNFFVGTLLLLGAYTVINLVTSLTLWILAS